jgi:hypothetical protein
MKSMVPNSVYACASLAPRFMVGNQREGQAGEGEGRANRFADHLLHLLHRPSGSPVTSAPCAHKVPIFDPTCWRSGLLILRAAKRASVYGSNL